MTPSGTSVCSVSIAVDRAGDMVDGVPGTGFFDVTFWGKTADNVSRYFSKGRMIAVTGELRHHRWEQDGQKRSKVEVNASRFDFCGDKPRDGDGGGSDDYQPAGAGDFPAPADDDIPF